MTIVCLEGPSGVGKTTAASAFCEAVDAVRVPEVNELFDPPAAPDRTWYVERQCDRWKRALAAERDHDVAVLDGDVFQPLWYNWFAADADDGPGPFATVETVAAFYGERLHERRVGFPDRYLLLGASTAILRERAATDDDRTRRNFEYHLGLVGPQRAYFEALAETTPGLVRFQEATTVDDTVAELAATVERAPTPTDRFDEERLAAMAAWLDRHDASDVHS
ncbi:AAA family ATPase [Halomarina rubra]|uniref:AAA family ATPase n=1 Tax=Halomarina rubra TaxID=2071873 RepID=A0ABD6AQ09_9EURY|nr:AAA family ATPase [Halomarina rubra]